MRVVAEGVETAEQLEKLRAMRCVIAQGYYFSKPLPREAIPLLLCSGHSEGAPPALGYGRKRGRLTGQPGAIVVLRRPTGSVRSDAAVALVAGFAEGVGVRVR